MKKIAGIVVVLMLAGSVSAQVSFNVGSSTLKGFGVPYWFTGFHLGVEVPRDDAMSFYGRYTHHFSRYDEPTLLGAVAKDPSTTPYILQIPANYGMNYNIFEGGSRYYIGDGFDFGFAGYGGTKIMIAHSNVKLKYSDFDESLYEIDESTSREGAILGIGVGLIGGAKYTIPRIGTFYSDFSMSYLALPFATQDNIYSDMYSSLLFSISVGYRRDLFW